MANEKNTAEQFVREVLKQCQSFNFKCCTFYIVFDKSCTDGTRESLEKVFVNVPEVKILYVPENKNIVDAYIYGYKKALEKNDWILEIDAGFSHQPSDIPLFFETMHTGYDCVFGSRFMKGGKYVYNNLYRYIISKGGSMLVNFLLGTQFKDMTSGFEMFTSKALESILEKKIRSTGPFFQTEIKKYAHDYNVTEIPILYKDGSHSIGGCVLFDAFFCLYCHFFERLAGKR